MSQSNQINIRVASALNKSSSKFLVSLPWLKTYHAHTNAHTLTFSERTNATTLSIWLPQSQLAISYSAKNTQSRVSIKNSIPFPAYKIYFRHSIFMATNWRLSVQRHSREPSSSHSISSQNVGSETNYNGTCIRFQHIPETRNTQ